MYGRSVPDCRRRDGRETWQCSIWQSTASFGAAMSSHFGSRTVRLQFVCPPDALHRTHRNADGFAHRDRLAPPVRAAWLRPKQTDLVPGKGQFRSRFTHPLNYGCPTTIFRDPRNRHRHHLSATLLIATPTHTIRIKRAGNGLGPVVMMRSRSLGRPGFRMLVMSRIRHAAIVP